MKPTLFLLAAGMGSRYGGLKQLDGLGPNGETIMDYSIYVTSLANWYSRHWTTCPKDSPARQNVQNRGARTMPS